MAMKKFGSVEQYLDAQPAWRKELDKLRDVLLQLPLQERIKWSLPCYGAAGKNVVGLGAFQSYVGLWFFQGALLSDPEAVLISAQEGKTKAMRQWRFQSSREIKPPLVRKYVREAIALAEAGKEIRPVRPTEVVVPPLLREALAADPRLRQSWEKLTPGRRREFAQHLESARREATRHQRLAAILPLIREGVGLSDRYRR